MSLEQEEANMISNVGSSKKAKAGKVGKAAKEKSEKPDKVPKIPRKQQPVEEFTEEDKEELMRQNPVASEFQYDYENIKSSLTEITQPEPEAPEPEYIPNANHLLEVRTCAGNTFKNLLSTLKSVLNDANMVFSEKGLKLEAIDADNQTFVHLFIPAKSFGFYHCKKRCVIGIDIEKLHNAFSTNKFNDIMCFIYREDEPRFLDVSFENYSKGIRSQHKIELLSLKECIIRDKIEYEIFPEIDSVMFQNICRDMSNVGATYLNIANIDDDLIFANPSFPEMKNGNTKCKVSIKVGTSEDSTNVKFATQSRWNNRLGEIEDTEKVVHAEGIFLLKYLRSFAKAANLAPRLRLHIKTDFPLICEYNIKSGNDDFGTLRYLLAGHTFEN